MFPDMQPATHLLLGWGVATSTDGAFGTPCGAGSSEGGASADGSPGFGARRGTHEPQDRPPIDLCPSYL